RQGVEVTGEVLKAPGSVQWPCLRAAEHPQVGGESPVGSFAEQRRHRLLEEAPGGDVAVDKKTGFPLPCRRSASAFWGGEKCSPASPRLPQRTTCRSREAA